MMLNKQMLLDRIKKQLDLEEQRAKEAHERRELDYQQRLAEWLAPGGSRDKLVRILREAENAAANGTPVTFPTVLEEYGRWSLWFKWSAPVYSYTPNSLLVSLRDLLESIEDEKISSTFLRDSGFRDFNKMFN